MLGYADWEVKGKPLDHILISQDRLMHAFEAAQQGTAIPNSGTVSLHRRNGQSFPAQVKLYPIEKEGEIKSILVFVEDISENEQIKAQAQHLEHRALLGEVTAVFAHEVRNPLNNLSTGLQLMSSRLPQEDPNQELISRLQNDCNRMSHLMESVLIYARQSEYKLEQLDIAQYIKRLLDRWQPRLAKVSINWYFLSDEGNTYIKGDPRALEQVFTNLLSNAIEAMAKTGGTLAIKVTPISIIPNYPQVEITVSDNGPGIPEEIRDRVFEPFLTTKPQGTGLGLAITKRIVIGHKGNITVDSFPGGTVFKIVIPAVNGDSQ
jgi:signal transduction histidine kinase